MVDFGALPPELNSARIYTGPGAGPLLAAAAAWDGLCAQLEAFSAGYYAATSQLSGQSWSGAASTAMAAAAAPYIAWLTTTAAQAGQAAGQARAAAAAYEAAFAATVPPAVVLANRALLASLVATNFFGQNTPAIAATEAVYAEMWAQDAAAMYGYAASASAAAALTPFDQPPQTTNSAGQSAQGVAAGQSQATLSQLMSAVPQQLHALTSGGFSNAAATTPTTTTTTTTATTSTTTLLALRALRELILPSFYGAQITKTPFYIGSFIAALPKTGVQASALPALAAPVPGTAAPAATSSPQWVLASAGRAAPVGVLSAPPNWPAATPASGPGASAAETDFRALPTWSRPPRSSAGLPAVGQIPNGTGRRLDKTAYRMRNRGFNMPRPTLGG